MLLCLISDCHRWSDATVEKAQRVPAAGLKSGTPPTANVTASALQTVICRAVSQPLFCMHLCVITVCHWMMSPRTRTTSGHWISSTSSSRWMRSCTNCPIFPVFTKSPYFCDGFKCPLLLNSALVFNNQQHIVIVGDESATNSHLRSSNECKMMTSKTFIVNDFTVS